MKSVYDRKIEELFSISPSFQKVGTSGYHPGLETMQDFAAFLGNPHKDLKIIHVAGTNGKGSVSHMLSSLLSASCPGTRTGLYTSPHLLDFRERITLVESGSFRHIGKEDVVSFLDRCDSFIRERKPSFFEITTAMALDFFARSSVDYVVLETGLGGRLDSTNIVSPLLNIITSIGLDHMNILGNTLEEIAAEKGGIIKDGAPVVAGRLPEEALQVIRSISRERGAMLVESASAEPPFFSEIDFGAMDLKSSVQRVNVRTVLWAYHLLSGMKLVPAVPATEAIVHAARNTGLRGRWERLSDSPKVLCDIGHNVEALSISMPQLEKESSGHRLFMVLGMCADKDIEAVRTLFPADADYVYTQAQGMRAMPADRLAQVIGRKPYAVEKTVAGAVRHVLSEASAEDYIFIGGSSFVVAEAISCFEENRIGR